jgi:hypothetical protein
MTTQPISTSKRKRGGQPGNANALKYGFYARKYKPADLLDLDACQFSGVKDEILMMRIYIRRVIELSNDIDNLPDAVNLLRVLSLASMSLTRLLKTQQFLAGADEVSTTLREAIEEIARELEIGDSSPHSPTA